MKAKTWFSSVFATTLACACSGSCAGDGPVAGAGGGPLPDAASDEGGDTDALADHDAAMTYDVEDAPEEPWGEAGWKPVAWDAPCAVEVAENPAAAVPPLNWDPCKEAAPGCEQARLDWDHAFGEPYASPRIIPWGTGYRVGAMLFYASKDSRSTIYDESGSPMVAWRATACGLVVPTVTPERAWMGAQDGAQSRWIVEPYEKLATTAATVDVKVAYQGYAANDGALGLWRPNGATVTIFDRLSGSTKTFGPPPGIAFYQPYPVNGSALLRHFPEINRAEGWIWNHDTSTVSPLLQPGSSISVADFASDGITLVWIEGELPINMNGLFPSASLWTSPFASDKSGIVATKRRALPLLGQVPSHASAGFYALYSLGDKMVHVYRLSDARHWAFKPPASSSDFYDVSYVDKDYVWYQTFANIYRQSLATLGPGDPPP